MNKQALQSSCELWGVFRCVWCVFVPSHTFMTQQQIWRHQKMSNWKETDWNGTVHQKECPGDFTEKTHTIKMVHKGYNFVKFCKENNNSVQS